MAANAAVKPMPMYSIAPGRFWNLCLIVTCCLGMTGGATQVGHGKNFQQTQSDSTQELVNAVARLNVQLGTGDLADSWRRFLQLNRLESQAAKGEQADLKTLIELSRIFDSIPAGTNYQPFDQVREALENQVQSLQRIDDQSPASLLQVAHQNFQPISLENLESQRKVADQALSQLEQFYQSELSPGELAEFEEKLSVDAVRKYLASINFQLAPEISEGKINSLIDDLRLELRKVVDALDALPFDDNPRPQPDQIQDPANQQNTPEPQSKDDRAQLMAKEKALNDKIKELTEQRNEIRRQDLPRKRERVENLRNLYQFEDQFTDAEKNFGDPYFVSAKFAFERFVRAYLYGTEDNLQEDFLKRIERLKEDLTRLEDAGDRRAYGIVGNTLEWLENAMQTPELVAAIRANYSFPNVYLHISGDFLNRLGSRPVNETRPVCEEIKGRQVKGYVQTSGTVSFDLIDDPDQVHVSIHSLNDIFSGTYIEQGPLKIFIQTRGKAEARRSLAASIGGILSENSYGAANMDNQFCGTSSQCNVINRVAEKKFREEKNDGDVRTASRARNELLERFNQETAKAVQEGRESLGNAQNRGYKRYNILPDMYVFSQNNQIHLVGKRASKWNLASSSMPRSFSESQDVELRIHDSLPTNYVEPMFRGKTFTNEELADLLKEMFQSEDNPLVAGEAGGNEESFSITFSNVRPIQFFFDNDRLAVVISATRFTRERRTINAGLTITLTFQIVNEEGKLFLIREGQAELDYIEGQEKSAELVAFRSLLNSKLNPPDQTEVVKVELPDNLLPVDRVEALKDRPAAKNMLLNQCRISNGWIYLGWNYDSKDGLARPSDTPSIVKRQLQTNPDKTSNGYRVAESSSK
jgi:hypothetical protein